ncbi:unnamed protein product, partial [marine sediment metagenome]
IYIVQDGQFVFASPLFEELSGYVHEELLGTHCLSHVHPEDREAVRKKAIESLKERSHLPYEYRFIKKNGDITWILERVTSTEYRGKRVTIGSFMDITEGKQAEEALTEAEARYRALFEASPDGILIADIETRKFKYANPAICKMLGYSEEQLTKMGVNGIHPEDKLEHVVAEFEAQARGEKTLAEGIPCLRKDGTILYADINTTTVLIGGRECNVGFFRDITERKQAE